MLNMQEMARHVMAAVDRKRVLQVFLRWQGRTLAFLGDSITESPTGYAEIVKCLTRRFTQPTARVLNAGVGGDTVVDGLSRVRVDVIREQPKFVFTNFGLNDSVRLGSGPDQVRTPLPRFEDAYRSLIELLLNCPARPAVFPLTTSGLMAERTDRILLKEDVAARNHAVKRLASEFNLAALDIFQKFEEHPDPGNLFAEDGLHLTNKGEVFMAITFLNEFIAATDEAAASAAPN